MGGYEAPAANASERVQVTICPTGAGQVHPAPAAAVGVNPAGRVSVTVTVPLVATLPELVAVSEYVEVVDPRTRGSTWLFAIVMSGAWTVTRSAPPPG